MLETAGKAEDVAELRVRPPKEADENYHPIRFNLIGDPSVPCSTYAQMIVDTYAAHRAGSLSGNFDFFNQRAMEHIARCFELMRALELPFNLRTAYHLLANKEYLKKTLDNVWRCQTYEMNHRHDLWTAMNFFSFSVGRIHFPALGTAFPWNAILTQCEIAMVLADIPSPTTPQELYAPSSRLRKFAYLLQQVR